MSVPAAYIGIILIWSTTPLAIQWSGTEVGYLFGITSRMMLGHLLNGEAIQTEALIGTAAILSGLLLFEYGQKAGKWVRDTMIG